MDTGWEHPRTYEYIAHDLPAVIGPITIIKAPLTMVELVLKRGMFPSKRRRFCTQELKVFPMMRHLADLQDAVGDVINTVGIRHGESKARSKMPEWEWSSGFDCEVWRPLIRWTEDHVIEIHQRHGLVPNPLYLQGATRVGCWPCIYARKSEIRLIADIDPSRIDLIRSLEEKVAIAAAYRYAEKGETFESLGYVKPAWFQAPVSNRTEVECEHDGPEGYLPQGCPRCNGTGVYVKRSGEPWSIDRVVAWSRTDYGGKQMRMNELFAASERDAGCMRWGLCDTGATSSD